MSQPIEPAALRVVKGNISDDELAALIMVFNSLAATRARAVRKVPAHWNSPQHAMRQGLPHGFHAWRRSALPH